MGFGITATGFKIKRLETIKAEIEADLRGIFGPQINLIGEEYLGQLVGIFSAKLYEQQELQQSIWLSFSPETASGVSLDQAVSYTGIKRLEATKGVGEGYAYGTLGTIITAGSIVSVDGNPESRWVVTENAEIGAGTNAVQLIEFVSEPDSGDWSLVFDGEEGSTLAYNDNAAAVESSLEGISGITSVTVSGNYTTGFTVTFTGVDGAQPQLTIRVGDNTLTDGGAQVGVQVTEVTPGVLPNVLVQLEAETAGQIPAYANSLTIIETPISGWDSFNNPTDVTMGRHIESDADLRARRLQTLSTAGATTLDAIRARLLEVDEVTSARVFENDTDTTDLLGRPPHSIEAVVVGGADQEIADTIWANKAAGIKTYGTETETVTDSEGYFHSVSFSRPAAIDIYVAVSNLVTDSNFPIDGDDAIKQAIVDYGDANYGIGEDVIFNQLYGPIAEIAGVIDFDLAIDITPAPTATDNITIEDNEVSFFDTANITVTV